MALPAHATTLTTLYSVTHGSQGTFPWAAVISLNGSLYGTTMYGGAAGHGTVYRMDPVTGATEVVYSFAGGKGGAAPQAALTAADGMLYGTTVVGGVSNAGTIFAVDPASGTEKMIYAFTGGADGGNPQSALIAFGGALYGTSISTVFKIDPTSGIETTLYTFGCAADGCVPGGLTELGGVLYGAAWGGGASNQGAVFKFNPSDGTEMVVYSFKGGKEGGQPLQAILSSVGGVLYGTTANGGAAGLGTLYKIDPATGTHRVVHAFAGGSDGANPGSTLTEMSGVLYGTTASGGKAGAGIAFAFDPASGQETVIHEFSTKPFSNCRALAGIGGSLFGTSYQGGFMWKGAIQKIVPDTGATTTLHAFTGFVETSANAGLINVGGTLYGTASIGGAAADGSVFRINPVSGAEKTLFHFAASDSGYPQAALTAVHGQLYGTTEGLSPPLKGNGTIFSLDPDTGGQATLYHFTGGNDGKQPAGALLNLHGILYGTTSGGGSAQYYGTIFKLDPATRVLTTIHSMGGEEGANPVAGLVAAGSALYGTASGGGFGYGTIFQVDPATGMTAKIYQFTGRTDGAFPRAALINVNGILYGTTSASNIQFTSAAPGTVFKFDPVAGVLTTLYCFTGAADGGVPQGPLMHAGNVLYGTTSSGGAADAGTVFKIDLGSGKETTVYAFSGSSDGGNPVAGLTKVGTNLFGMTSSGGSADAGTVFKLQP
jgi:uncharacterized repeat protein (TIGR03803 family)